MLAAVSAYGTTVCLHNVGAVPPRGTLVPHPSAENKTEAADRERLAQALSTARK
jgi:hypothetical protein